jgi:hypothetical protein
MIPMLAVLRVEGEARRNVHLWLPLFFFWLLALPVAIVTLPVVAVVLVARGRNPLRLFGAVWGLLCAVSGTRLDVQKRRSLVHVQVY